MRSQLCRCHSCGLGKGFFWDYRFGYLLCWDQLSKQTWSPFMPFPVVVRKTSHTVHSNSSCRQCMSLYKLKNANEAFQLAYEQHYLQRKITFFSADVFFYLQKWQIKGKVKAQKPYQRQLNTGQNAMEVGNVQPTHTQFIYLLCCICCLTEHWTKSYLGYFYNMFKLYLDYAYQFAFANKCEFEDVTTWHIGSGYKALIIMYTPANTTTTTSLSMRFT